MPTARSMAHPTAGGCGIRTTLVPLPHTQHPVTVFFAQVGDVSPGGFEDPQAEQPEHGYQCEVACPAGDCSSRPSTTQVR
jgi:hypothetical protein